MSEVGLRAFSAGCVLLAVAFATALAGLLLEGFGHFDDSLHAGLLRTAADTIAVLSFVFFAQVVPPQQGRLVRSAALAFWVLVAAGVVFEGLWWATPRLGFGRGAWASLAYVAAWGALDWAIGFRPLASRVAALAAAVAVIGCIVSLAVGLALSWGSFDVFGRGQKPLGLAVLLALFAAAVSVGSRVRQTSPDATR